MLVKEKENGAKRNTKLIMEILKKILQSLNPKKK